MAFFGSFRKKGNPKSERQKKNTKEIIVRGKKWCLWDKVEVGTVVGFISGFSAPGFNLVDINGSKFCSAINSKLAKLICRNNNWLTID